MIVSSGRDIIQSVPCFVKCYFRNIKKPARDYCARKKYSQICLNTPINNFVSWLDNCKSSQRFAKYFLRNVNISTCDFVSWLKKWKYVSRCVKYFLRNFEKPANDIAFERTIYNSSRCFEKYLMGKMNKPARDFLSRLDTYNSVRILWNIFSEISGGPRMIFVAGRHISESSRRFAKYFVPQISRIRKAIFCPD